MTKKKPSGNTPNVIVTSIHCPPGATVPPEPAADLNTMLTPMLTPTPILSSRIPTPLSKSPTPTNRFNQTRHALLMHRRSSSQLVAMPRIVPAVATVAVPPIVAIIAMLPSQFQALHPKSRRTLVPQLPTNLNVNLHVIQMELMQMISSLPPNPPVVAVVASSVAPYL